MRHSFVKQELEKRYTTVGMSFQTIIHMSFENLECVITKISKEIEPCGCERTTSPSMQQISKHRCTKGTKD